MKKVSFLAVLALFLGLGFVACSSKESEPAQEPVEAVGEESSEMETSAPAASENQTEATNATTTESSAQ
ncbi:MAG: hypothetical protein LBF23_04220 [Endomicrobium sp.]|jgi:ABC-type oligopeptide transport system substrate-binding subunit|nr:hypothetical protein [Endomicrobium sp.]